MRGNDKKHPVIVGTKYDWRHNQKGGSAIPVRHRPMKTAVLGAQTQAASRAGKAHHKGEG